MENDVKEMVMPNPGGAVMTQRQLALLEYVLDPGLVAMVVPEVVMVTGCVLAEHCAPQHVPTVGETRWVFKQIHVRKIK